jgi:outer membrane protein assembly factor BamB
VKTTPHPAAFRSRIRWWPALAILLITLALTVWLRQDGDAAFQRRNLQTLAVGLGAVALLALWWLGFSRAAWRTRLAVFATLTAGALVFIACFRIRGVTGDLVPILEPRWTRSTGTPHPDQADFSSPVSPPPASDQPRPDFPQFLGPHRTAILDGPRLDPDWSTRPPRLLWRQPIGPAWSGFAIVGTRAFTQEQRGAEECVTCYDAMTGRLLWRHIDVARYFTTLAGEGPRCTPTVVSNRVYTLGATGFLNCLSIDTGRQLWQRRITSDTDAQVPEWGFSSSPLALEELVLVGAGEAGRYSLLAYHLTSGELAWSSGNSPASYSSPIHAKLAGASQILTFNVRQITSHDPHTGRILWNHPWPGSHPRVAVPLVVATNRVLFSSGYGVGSELIELSVDDDAGSWTAQSIWKSRRMKAKFANLVARDGHLFGLDDGILACLNLADGTQLWKEGRYGHGQGLLIDNLLLLMAESGELVLLRPTPQSRNELRRLTVFSAKTWNPIALAGDLLLVRNDQEAAALILPLMR